MPDQRPLARRELTRPYEHPYRHTLVSAWRHQRELRRATAATVALSVGGAVGSAAGVELLGVFAGLGATLGYFLILMWIIAIVREGRRLTRSWRTDSELATVRARRPQAGGE